MVAVLTAFETLLLSEFEQTKPSLISTSSSAYTPSALPAQLPTPPTEFTPAIKSSNAVTRTTQSPSSVTKIDGIYYFACPWCDGGIQVLEGTVACKIFRHGVFIGKKQEIIPQHLPEAECNALLEHDPPIVYGCCRPYRFDTQIVEKCGYI